MKIRPKPSLYIKYHGTFTDQICFQSHSAERTTQQVKGYNVSDKQGTQKNR